MVLIKRNDDYYQLIILFPQESEMLLSLQELIVWIGVGPFEVALHSFAFLIFTCLATLQVEGVVSTSWHAIFSPLYVALVLHAYYLAIVSSRMTIWGHSNTSKKMLIFVIPMSFVGAGLLFYVEYSTAGFLDGTLNQPNLFTSYVGLIIYLFVRMFFVYRGLITSSSLS